MIYRLTECCIYDSEREPPTTVWVESAHHNDAAEIAELMLSKTWGVTKHRVCIQATPNNEFEIFQNAVEGNDAGDRRLWACGSWGHRPLYYPFRVLFFVGAHQRSRLLKAFRASQAHALLMADEVEMEIAQSPRDDRDMRLYEVRNYREYAQADLI